MPPATSSSVLRRVDDEGDIAKNRNAALNDPRTVWREAFRTVRAETERRSAPLSAEDQIVQSMSDASPTKWHRAHTTWFFEQFLLVPHLAGYRVFDQRFAYLFNSYYVAAGPRHARPQRELILTDILHAFAQNPVVPGYDVDWRPPPPSPTRGFAELPCDIHTIGFEGAGYCFDN